VDQSTTAIKKAADVDTWAKDIPFFGWLTDPSNKKIDLPLVGPTNSKAFWLTAGAAALLGALVVVKGGRAATNVYVEQYEDDEDEG
jgi:hypothetical protein